MGLVDRLIARAVSGLRSRRGVTVARADAHGLALTDGTQRPWSAVERVVAVTVAGLGGDLPTLLFALKGDETVSIAADDDGWAALAELIALHLPGARSWTDWQLRLTADPAAAIEVYARAGTG